MRDDWVRQWAQIDPAVTPTAYTDRPDGSVAVAVHQVVTTAGGELLDDSQIVHVYRFAGEFVSRMDVEEA